MPKPAPLVTTDRLSRETPASRANQKKSRDRCHEIASSFNSACAIIRTTSGKMLDVDG
jgi:hypothetical protein